MDAENGEKVRLRSPSRSTILAIAVCAALTVFVAWSVRQSRLTQEALDRARAAERSATQARADAAQTPPPLRGKAKILRDEALRRAARRDLKQDERIRELYSEIDSLIHIQDRIQHDIHGLRGRSSGPAGAAPGEPRPTAGPQPGATTP
jgi:hypothetical protein